jgi:hypothetical protein
MKKEEIGRGELKKGCGRNTGREREGKIKRDEDSEGNGEKKGIRNGDRESERDR